jgi:uncharacterized protein (DUF488 family)
LLGIIFLCYNRNIKSVRAKRIKLKKTIYTIGYSGFKIDAFLEVLKSFNIDYVIDVRSIPRSMYFDAYNEKALSKILTEAGVEYTNLKTEFGARQENSEFYTDNYLDYKKFANSRQFRNGVEIVKELTDKGNVICLMCAEKDPLNCHRAILCGKTLNENGFDILHIVPAKNGIETERHSDLEKRLIKLYHKSEQCSMFNNNDLLAESYQKHNVKIGYKP